MGYGIAAAGGLEAAQQGLRQRLMDQMLLQKQKQDMAIQLREQALREQEAQRHAEEFSQTIAERKAAVLDRSHASDVGNAAKLAPELPMDQNVSPQAASILKSGGLGGQLYTPPTMGENVNATPYDPTAANPSMNLGTHTQQVMGRLLNSTAPDSPERRALEYEQATGRNAPAGIFDKTPKPAEPLEQVIENGKPIFRPRSQASGMTPYHVPPQPPAQVVVQTDNGPGMVNPRSANPTITPIRDASGAPVKPKTGQTVESRLVSAKAVLQTGNDMIKELSDPAVAAQLGPVMSRYNNVADFVGNPPPEFSKLAGLIESYALANMGVHGMRSNTGAEAIKATLGQGRHNAQSIISTIQGLNGFANHLMQNEGRGLTDVSGAGDETPDQRRARLRKAAGLP